MKQKYDVTGMTCSACSAHVEKAARAIPGVRDVTVNLLTNSMVIESDTQIANSAVIEAVSAAGYGAIPVGETNVQKREKTPQGKIQQQLEEMKMRLFISAVFLIPLMYVSMGHMVGLPQFGFLIGYENSITFAMVQFLLTLSLIHI